MSEVHTIKTTRFDLTMLLYITACRHQYYQQTSFTENSVYLNPIWFLDSLEKTAILAIFFKHYRIKPEDYMELNLVL